MVGNRDAPTMVEGNNKATATSKLGRAKPSVVHENIHGNRKLVNTRLKYNNILGAHIVEEKEKWFYGWADKYDVWNNYSYTPTK